MRFTVDRIEATVAVCELEDGSFCAVPVSLFPDKPVEGGVYNSTEGAIAFDRQATEQRKERIRLLTEGLFE